MFVVSVHNFKMSEQIRSSAEYNQRTAIIEGLHAGRSQIEIIQFFGYPKSIIYDIAAKYLTLEMSKKDLTVVVINWRVSL